ncbi:hypothetical protein C8Q80DRAFT_888928 [Daedaleopsis nitida]|nr:hypothetical protein C8Q80DRAFT_888928 [Daedaleopsis nitida]
MTTPAPQTSSPPGSLVWPSQLGLGLTETSSMTSTGKTAPAPFDKVGADIILRTSDTVDFHVYSHVLILASPFFETMLSLPQPSLSSPGDAQTADNRPVIDVSENSDTLETLLRICYPIERQESVRSLAQMEAEWNAAVKYDMAMPRAVLAKELLKAAYTSPLAAWAVACRVGSEPLVRCAAENLKKTSPLIITEGDLRGITAADLYRLREFHSGRAPAVFHFLTPPNSTTVTGHGIHISGLPLFPERFVCFADLICRSSDGYEFKVHRGFLSTASAMLYTRIQLVLSDWKSGKKNRKISTHPVLEFDEDRITLSVLLMMCYQPLSELPKNATTLYNIIVAAKKYELDGVCKAVQTQWGEWATRGVDALSFYLVAARLEWKEIAQVAAAHTLSDPLPSSGPHAPSSIPTSNPLYSPFMESTPALVYLRLIQYHEAYLGATQEIFRRSSCQYSFAKVLQNATLSPHDGISFTSSAVVESYQQGSQNYGYRNGQNLGEALDEVEKKIGELKVTL